METVAVIVSFLSILIAYRSMMYSKDIANKVQKDVKLKELYSGFQQANQATIENTQFLKDVHGLKNISDDECRNIAYLSTLMDAFQQENQEHKDSTFLDRITSIENNKRRWQKMKEIYYGDFDKKFIKNLKETTN